MTPLRILSTADIEELWDVHVILDDVERALENIAAGEARWPRRTAIDIDGNRLLTMSGYAPLVGLGLKCVSSYPSNAGNDLPAHQGLVILFDPENGTPVCLLDGSEFTAMRTAVCSAVAARRLARADASRMAVIGSGAQARGHVQVLSSVLDVDEVRIAARNPAAAASLAGRYPGAGATSSIEEAVRGADIVVLCTASPVAVLDPSWIAPGAHISSVGCAAPDGELGPDLVRSGRVFVESLDALEPPPVGAPDLRASAPGEVTLLGDVLMGVEPGRRVEDEITIFKSCGHALEDVAVARALYRASIDRGMGADIGL
ncbi:ornithine cyclodeaminase family protein [Blastococcus saxobsidens]|uniref:Ornithine cyclodeaminase/mu-crystallin n=1 Tax=Blastococcus saxobsidens (strain DD2) TaxID=1146883 RepID=H6RSY0_BLASD|nr:ornithine cyclodeaminase family protein [Blastococcus saxobsidens]CCG04283.1 ornithine cyclodeaminase/mu-crystallin [Blastococcus saxobsidens DD2]